MFIIIGPLQDSTSPDRQAALVEQPNDLKARVSDHDIAFSSRAIPSGPRLGSLANMPAFVTPPFSVNGKSRFAGTRGCDEDDLLGPVEGDPVRARNVVDQHRELAARREPIDTTAAIVQAGLALVCEVEVAVAREDEIVDALEPFFVGSFQERRDRTRAGVEQHQAVPVVGNEDAPVAMDSGRWVRHRIPQQA